MRSHSGSGTLPGVRPCRSAFVVSSLTMSRLRSSRSSRPHPDRVLWVKARAMAYARSSESRTRLRRRPEASTAKSTPATSQSPLQAVEHAAMRHGPGVEPAEVLDENLLGLDGHPPEFKDRLRVRTVRAVPLLSFHRFLLGCARLWCRRPELPAGGGQTGGWERQAQATRA